MPNKLFQIGYGPLLPPIKKQLAEYRLCIKDEKQLKRYEAQRHAVNILDIAGLLPNSQVKKTLEKLHKRVINDMANIEPLPTKGVIMSKRGRWYRKPTPNPISQEKLTSKLFKACEIKLPFLSEDDAEAAITRAGLSKSGYRRGSSYKCQYCEFWHITSKKKEFVS